MHERNDVVKAALVDAAINKQEVQGVSIAAQFLANCGIAFEIAHRVLLFPNRRRT